MEKEEPKKIVHIFCSKCGHASVYTTSEFVICKYCGFKEVRRDTDANRS